VLVVADGLEGAEFSTAPWFELWISITGLSGNAGSSSEASSSRPSARLERS
jgi:hypothetical protein